MARRRAPGTIFSNRAYSWASCRLAVYYNDEYKELYYENKGTLKGDRACAKAQSVARKALTKKYREHYIELINMYRKDHKDDYAKLQRDYYSTAS